MSKDLTTEEKILIKQINQLCESRKYEDAEKIFEKFVEQNPNNLEMLLRFGFFEYYALHDDLKGKKYLERVLKLDRNNLDALILLSDIDMAGVDKNLFKKLSSVYVEDPEYASMIEFCKALFYQDEDDNEMYEKSLKASIELWPNHVFNYLKLACFYKRRGNLKEARNLMEKVLENVKFIYPENGYDIDYTDYQEYFNELIKRIHISSSFYNEYLKELNDLNKKLKIETFEA